MGYLALSHATPSFYDAISGTSQYKARVGQREVGSGGWVKFKSKDTYPCTGYSKCEDSQWWAAIREWTKRREGQCHCSGHQFVPDETSSPSLSQPPSVTTRRPLLSPAKTYSEANLSPSDPFWVIAASTSEELLAAATLRAHIFYTYPQADVTLSGTKALKARVANDFLVKDLIKTRVKAEFNRESKFEALGMRVKCLLAVCRQSSLESLTLPGRRIATPLHLAPLSGTDPLVAIGTLDVQVHKGKKSVKEYFPVEQENTLEQAYIFNLCVIKEARRMGVAKALMVAALKVAKQMELQILFVHVEADNLSALALYNSLGYAAEEEESLEVESLLRRPRRILLSFWVL